MKISLLVFPGLLLLSACGSGDPKPGQPPRWNPYSALPPRNENYRGGGADSLKRYDADKDGTLTREELMAGLHAEFSAADKSANGCLSDDEVTALNQMRIAADRSTATPVQDWNQDGCVNFQEFATAPVSLFDELDRDHNGRITPQEFAQASGRGGAGRGQVPGGEGGRGGRGGRGEPP